MAPGQTYVRSSLSLNNVSSGQNVNQVGNLERSEDKSSLPMTFTGSSVISMEDLGIGGIKLIHFVGIAADGIKYLHRRGREDNRGQSHK